MSTPRAMILREAGINCNAETSHAIEQAGGQPVDVHISQLLDGSAQLADFNILMLSGGFANGDTIRSGAILGRKLRERLAEDMNNFVALGKPVVGICNGFQALVEAGLLPTGQIDDTPKNTSLIYNENGQFECRWETVRVGASACRFIRPEDVDTLQRLPVAHGEGRFVRPTGSLPPEQVVLSYTDTTGGTAAYPDNPNGSPDGITAICDPSGVVLGMMPHPERAVYQHQHQNWRRGEGQRPFGRILFQGIVEHAQSV